MTDEPNPNLGAWTDEALDDALRSAIGHIDDATFERLLAAASADRPGPLIVDTPDQQPGVSDQPDAPDYPIVRQLDQQRRGRTRTRTAKWLLSAAAAVFVIALAVASRQSDAPQPTTAEQPTPQTAIETFKTNTLPSGLRVTRTWTVEDGTFTGILEFRNHGKTWISDYYREILPTSLAGSSADVTTKPEAALVEPAPVFIWRLVVGPDEPKTLTYTIKVAKDASHEDLARWRVDMVNAVESVREKAKTQIATIQLLTPMEGQVVQQATIPFQGITNQPDAGITVNGKAAEQDGINFSAEVTLVPGSNEIVIQSVTVSGVAHEVVVRVTYEPPGN